MLVLHNLTPHIHAHAAQGEPAIQKKTEESSGWLIGIFGIDMGEGHLESFSVQKEQMLDAGLDFTDFKGFTFFAVFSKKSTFFLIKTLKNRTSPPLSAVHREHNLPAFGLRGPPFYI